MDKLVGYAVLENTGNFFYGPDRLHTFKDLKDAQATVVYLVKAGWQASNLTIVGLVDLTPNGE